MDHIETMFKISTDTTDTKSVYALVFSLGMLINGFLQSESSIDDFEVSVAFSDDRWNKEFEDYVNDEIGVEFGPDLSEDGEIENDKYSDYHAS